MQTCECEKKKTKLTPLKNKKRGLTQLQAMLPSSLQYLFMNKCLKLHQDEFYSEMLIKFNLTLTLSPLCPSGPGRPGKPCNP